MERVEITSFRGPHFFLSNSAPIRVRWRGQTYPSVAAAFEGSECAKAHETVKLDVMRDLLRQKFTGTSGLSGVLRRQLLATGDAPIIRLNNDSDIFWGQVEMPDGTRVGDNWLGRIIMELRAEMRFNDLLAYTKSEKIFATYIKPDQTFRAHPEVRGHFSPPSTHTESD